MALMLMMLFDRRGRRPRGMRQQQHRILPAVFASLVILLQTSTSLAGHVYTDSFPPWDEEYRYQILDPHSADGSPYGGYSRATRSRLASLPLPLPGKIVSSPEQDGDPTQQLMSQQQKLQPMYMSVTDSEGREFACRVYHEDELDPSSLSDSMFDAPKLRKEVSVDVTTGSAPKDGGSDAAVAKPDKPAGDTTISAPAELGDGSVLPEADTSQEDVVGASSPTTQSNSLMSLLKNPDPKDTKDGAQLIVEKLSSLVLAEQQLTTLEGICGQIHKGWWSYEWCYMSSLSQFHLEYEKENGQIRIESVTNLGTYETRYTIIDLEDLPPNPFLSTDSAVVAPDSDDKTTTSTTTTTTTPPPTEIARVVDTYTSGQLCDETGEPRTAFVHFMCCGQDIMEKTRGLLHREGQRIKSHAAAVMHIVEHPTCSYNVTVCTPLLCHESLSDTKTSAASGVLSGTPDELQGAALMASSQVLSSSSSSSPPVDESTLTVREILKRALSHFCIESETGGWWTYEYCHGNRVRQYHDAIGTSKSATGSIILARTVESEHVLGLYDPVTANAHPGADWRFVVNTTTSKTGGGNGAYFELEYTGGDVCDHSDVTDAAIIAGNAGVGGVQRACSVRYYCGTTHTITVQEDSTCHYVVHVMVPALCKHPLFVAPVTKKQVFKCLPVD